MTSKKLPDAIVVGLEILDLGLDPTTPSVIIRM